MPFECFTTKFLFRYGSHFGMERFLVSPWESPEAGVVIGEEVGMRMKVGEWITQWMCSEVGTEAESEGGGGFKLVLAEPLEGRRDSHVQKFLDDHGCPGVQHVGLGTAGDIAKAVGRMQEMGAEFRRPPPTYYQMARGATLCYMANVLYMPFPFQQSKRAELILTGCDVDEFSRLGLLLDSEADNNNTEEDKENTKRDDDDDPSFLIQIFTKPLFSHDTFFLEVLQRRGAKGFGAGNITALARSIQLYQEEREKSQQL